MKILLALILILSCNLAYAETRNEKYSFGDFTHQSFTHLKTDEFNDMVIYRSCLYQEATQIANNLAVVKPDPRKQIFPDGIKGVILRECNADNVEPQTGLTIEENCSNDRIQSYEDKDGDVDGDDWVLDKDNKPVSKVNER